MASRQSLWTFTLIVVSIAGLISLMGCGPSKAQQQMSDILTQYGQAVDKYAELNGTADADATAKAKAEVEALQKKWSGVESEMASNLTPQVMEKLEKEFEIITKKYKEIPSHT